MHIQNAVFVQSDETAVWLKYYNFTTRKYSDKLYIERFA